MTCHVGCTTTDLKFINKLCETCLTYRAQKTWQLVHMGIPVLFQHTLHHKGLITSAAVMHLTATVALHMLPVPLLCIEPLQAEPTFLQLMMLQ